MKYILGRSLSRLAEIRNNPSRVRTAIRRRIAGRLLFNNFRTISLERQESNNTQLFSKFNKGIDITFLRILDPRDKVEKVHAFAKRDFYTLDDAILEPRQGLIYSKNFEILVESTTWNPIEVFRSYPMVKKPVRKFKKLDKGIPLSASSYYHWLIEDLPATIMTMTIEPDLPLITAKNPPRYVLDFALNSRREIIFSNEPVVVQSLTFMEKGKDSGWPHPNQVNVLLNYASFKAAIEVNSKKRFYISRLNSRRSPRNEREIEKLMKQFGFTVLYLEQMSIFDQISMISQADIVAGIHGAGLSNSIWMQEGSKLLDIVNNNYWTECYHRLCFVRNQRYSHMVYDGDPLGSVNLEDLKNTLRNL